MEWSGEEEENGRWSGGGEEEEHEDGLGRAGSGSAVRAEFEGNFEDLPMVEVVRFIIRLIDEE